jgi:hypothetical protein
VDVTADHAWFWENQKVFIKCEPDHTRRSLR